MMILRENIKAQSTIEFTFAVVAIIFLIYGMVMVFRWAGMDLAQRRYEQDTSLTALSSVTGDPASELSSDVGSGVMPMAAMYHGDIANGENTSQ
jgi:hypothetical protein